MKKCRKCLADKPLSEYYAHKDMVGGLLHICKECVKARVKKHRAANIEKIREYDRNRPNAAERYAETAARSKTQKGREITRIARAKWAKNNPHKVAAQRALAKSIKSGKTVRGNCRDCGDGKVHGHHTDYDKPLDVIWLCQKHHAIEHKKMRAAER